MRCNIVSKNYFPEIYFENMTGIIGNIFLIILLQGSLFKVSVYHLNFIFLKRHNFVIELGQSCIDIKSTINDW